MHNMRFSLISPGAETARLTIPRLINTEGRSDLRMLFAVTVACLGYMAGSGRPVGLATRSCVSMKKTVEEAEPADRPEINIALKSIVEFQVRAAPG